MRRILNALILLAILLVGSSAFAEENDEAEEADVATEVDEAAAADAEEDEAAAEEDAAEVAAEDDDADLDIADEPAINGHDGPDIAVAPHLGVTAPQPFGDLGSFPTFGLDVGYILPFDVGGMSRPLQIGLELSYTAPGAEDTGTHAMLGESGAGYEWHLRQRMLTTQLNLLWRFMPAGQQLSAHAIVAPRLYMMESVLEASGNSGNDFGENRETNSEFGVAIGGGAEYMVGPGAAVGTLLFAMSPLDQRITGDANTGTFNLSVGYRLFF